MTLSSSYQYARVPIQDFSDHKNTLSTPLSPSPQISRVSSKVISTCSRVFNTPGIIDTIMGYSNYDDFFSAMRIDRNFYKQIIRSLTNIVAERLAINSPFYPSPKWDKKELEHNSYIYKGIRLLRYYLTYWTAGHLKHKIDSARTSYESPHNQLLQQPISTLSKTFLLSMEILWHPASQYISDAAPSDKALLSVDDVTIRIKKALEAAHSIKGPLVTKSLNSEAKTLPNLLIDGFDIIHFRTINNYLHPGFGGLFTYLNKVDKHDVGELRYAICTMYDYLLKRLDFFIDDNARCRTYRNTTICVLRILFERFYTNAAQGDIETAERSYQDLCKALKASDSTQQHEVRKRDMRFHHPEEIHFSYFSDELYDKNRLWIAKTFNTLLKNGLLEVNAPPSTYMPFIDEYISKFAQERFLSRTIVSATGIIKDDPCCTIEPCCTIL